MSFPVGEQFFIDSVRNGLKALPPELQDKYRAEVQGFIGQEATHRRIHALFNGHLEKQGLVNDWEPRAQERMKLLDGLDPRHHLGITAANEHFTAILADWMLANPDLLAWQRGAPAHAVAVAQRRRIRAQEHRVRPVPGLGGNHEWRSSGSGASHSSS
jgi:predicted metal-dependent hydrolase